MTTRDLTKSFVDIRSEAKAKRVPRPAATVAGDGSSVTPGDVQLLQDTEKGPDWSQTTPQLPPRWVDMVDKIEDNIKKIQGQMKELSGLHRKRLLVTFDDSGEAREERVIQEKTEAITDLFRQAERVLGVIGKQQGDESESELRVRKNIQRSLAFKLNQLSTNFRAGQKEYLQKLKAQKEGGDPDDFAFINKKDEPLEGGDTGFNAQQLAALDNIDILVNERDSEIKQIAQSIQELAGVMKHLQELVIDQGTVLDRIDYNMDSAVEKVQEGVKQLEAAEKTAKDGTANKCIVVLLVLVFILILVMVIKHSAFKRRR